MGHMLESWWHKLNNTVAEINDDLQRGGRCGLLFFHGKFQDS